MRFSNVSTADMRSGEAKARVVVGKLVAGADLNLRPSGYEPDGYRTALSRVKEKRLYKLIVIADQEN
jgi:hypothetical protein